MKNSHKIAGAAHIKRNTEGTSNEISLSVLDAAKAGSGEGSRKSSGHPHFPHLGVVSLFTLGRAKKPAPTPTKESGLTLSTGEFVSAEDAKDAASTPQTVPGISSDGPDGASSTASIASVAGSVPLKPSRGAGAAGAGSWQSPAEEVARRKALRKRGKRLAVASIMLVALALIAVGGTVLYSGWVSKQDARGQLAARVDVVMSDWAVVGKFTQFTETTKNTPLDSFNVEATQAAYEAESDRLKEAENSLLATKADIESLQPSLADANDLEMSNQALAMINAQLSAMHAGRDVMDAYLNAGKAYALVSQGWGKVLEADALARAAAALVTSTSVDNVNASMAKSNEALGLFISGRDAVSAAQGVCDVDFAPYIDYINLRIEAQGFALSSDRAYLDRNKEVAQQANSDYNRVDAQAADLIAEIGPDPLASISQSLDTGASEAIASFEAESQRAMSLEAVLDEFLAGF